MVEVNITTALLSSDIGLLCLHVGQNSIISSIPRQYFLDGNEGKQETSLTGVATKLREKTGKGPIYKVLQNKALCLPRSLGPSVLRLLLILN